MFYALSRVFLFKNLTRRNIKHSLSLSLSLSLTHLYLSINIICCLSIGLFVLYLCLFNSQYQISSLSNFADDLDSKPGTSVIGSDRSANWATTTALLSLSSFSSSLSFSLSLCLNLPKYFTLFLLVLLVTVPVPLSSPVYLSISFSIPTFPSFLDLFYFVAFAVHNLFAQTNATLIHHLSVF